MAAFLGMRGTGDWVANQRPENWREMILFLYPNGKAPLTAIMAMMGSEKTDDPIFHWWERALPDQRATITGVWDNAALDDAADGGEASGTTMYVQMSAEDAVKFVAGHQVLLRDANILDTDINAKVSADSVINGADSYITIKLLEADDNSANGGDLTTVDVALIIGTINAEGGTSPDSLIYDPTEYFNYTQIFRTALEHTRTAMKTKLRTGDQVKQAKKEALELHSIEMERAFIFGIRTSNLGTNGKPERTTGGIKSFLSTNVYDFTKASGTSTWLNGGENWLDERFEEIFRYGNTDKIALCGSGALLGIQKLAKANGLFDLTAKTTSYGVNVLQWVTPFGIINLKTHPLFSFEATTRNAMLIVDPTFLMTRFIDDTTYKPNIQDNDLDGEKSEYLTESGLELHFERAHGWLDGVGLDNP